MVGLCCSTPEDLIARTLDIPDGVAVEAIRYVPCALCYLCCPWLCAGKSSRDTARLERRVPSRVEAMMRKHEATDVRAAMVNDIVGTSTCILDTWNKVKQR